MELKEFIKNTLVQITEGVLDAQNELKDSGCLINPEGFTLQGGQIKMGYKNEFRSIQTVKMNIAVMVTENSGTQKGIGVVNLLKANISSDEKISNERITTLEFEVPIALPIMNSNK